VKILCYIDSLGAGGAQRQLVNVASGLKGRGHHVEVLTYYPSSDFRGRLDAAEVPYRCEEKRSRWSPMPVVHLWRKVADASFAAVIAYLETPAVYAELASFAARKFALVVSERSTVPVGGMRLQRRLKSQLHRRADAVVSNSYSQTEWLRLRFPYLAHKLHTIPNGVDTRIFSPAAATTPNRAVTLRLLGVGRIAPPKNLPMLARALSACLRCGTRVSLDWAGRVEDAREYEDTRATMAAAGAEEHWRWLGERADIPELMRRYDALVLASSHEGLPNVICEAFASGLPVLASRVSDNERLLGRNERGLLFHPGDPEDIARAISVFAGLAEPARVSMARSARSFAERALSLDACVSGYERLLERLCAEPRT